MDPLDKPQGLSLTCSFVLTAPIFYSMVLYFSLVADETDSCIIKRRGQRVCVDVYVCVCSRGDCLHAVVFFFFLFFSAWERLLSR